jgi:protease-4
MNEPNEAPKIKTNIFASIKAVLGFIQNYFKALIFLLILCIVFAISLQRGQDDSNLVKIYLGGVIMESESVIKNIKLAYDDDNVKGILFVVNSPGGAVSPSIEISMAIKRFKDKKPVVAYAAGTMTSGSYYASVHANHIIANPGSIIGSIGVIMQAPNIEELAKKIGISEQVVSAGEYKEAGTITRQWTSKERESLQELVNDTYELFVNDIAEARGLDKERADEFANAKIFIASKAQKAGLIDTVGSIKDAEDMLVKLSGVEKPVWKEPDLVDKLTKKIASETREQISLLFYGLKAY